MHADDHIGGIVHDTERETLVGLNWGSRTAYTWPLDDPSAPIAEAANPSHFVDYQDCKFLGQPEGMEHPVMLCGGIAGLSHPGADGAPVAYELGGIAIVDAVTMQPLHEVPFQEYTDGGHVATRNAIDVAIVDGRLRLYLVADDDDSDLLVYEAR